MTSRVSLHNHQLQREEEDQDQYLKFRFFQQGSHVAILKRISKTVLDEILHLQPAYRRGFSQNPPATMQSEDITGATINVNTAFPPSPRRSTVSAMQTHSQPRVRANNVQCTHLTVTRLYTKDFRCSNCLRAASMGWLYRCTQDRELLLEDDMERGIADTFDKLCDIFERPASPFPRSPVARLDKLSFFGEITEEQHKTYSKDQLNLILKQRAQVLDTASEPESEPSKNPYSSSSFYSIPLDPSSPPSSTKIQQKPWLPLKGGECQYKCCHTCRYNLNERSYLSLGGIADGDIPPTAILGFGFHLSKQRPVALAKHARNLGLRPNPLPGQDSNTSTATDTPTSATFSSWYKNLPPTPKSRSSNPFRRNTNAGDGLGIFTHSMNATAPSASSTSSTTEFPKTTNTGMNPRSAERGITSLADFVDNLSNLPPANTISSPIPASNPLPSDSPLYTSGPSVQNLKSFFLRHTSYHIPNSREEAKQEMASLTPLPPASPEEQAMLLESEGLVNETFVWIEMKENDELPTVAGAEEPQIEARVHLADLISQF